MAQQDVALPVVDLVEVRHRFKAFIQPPGVGKSRVVVAPDEVLAAPEPPQRIQRHVAAVVAHVPHHIYCVSIRYGLVPAADEGLVHFLHSVKGPSGQHGRIVKVQVGGVIDHSVPSCRRYCRYCTICGSSKSKDSKNRQNISEKGIDNSRKCDYNALNFR